MALLFALQLSPSSLYPLNPSLARITCHMSGTSVGSWDCKPQVNSKLNISRYINREITGFTLAGTGFLFSCLHLSGKQKTSVFIGIFSPIVPYIFSIPFQNSWFIGIKVVVIHPLYTKNNDDNIHYTLNCVN